MFFRIFLTRIIGFNFCFYIRHTVFSANPDIDIFNRTLNYGFQDVFIVFLENGTEYKKISSNSSKRSVTMIEVAIMDDFFHLLLTLSLWNKNRIDVVLEIASYLCYQIDSSLAICLFDYFVSCIEDMECSMKKVQFEAFWIPINNKSLMGTLFSFSETVLAIGYKKGRSKRAFMRLSPRQLHSRSLHKRPKSNLKGRSGLQPPYTRFEGYFG